MKIWVDADACPVAIKEILFKAAQRTEVHLTLVANRPVRIPKSSFVKFLQVSSGLDVADNKILDMLESGDLVITSDIPLAAKAVALGCFALDPRGEVYTNENIRERLSTRDFMDVLRSSGIDTNGPGALSKRDRQAFANSLDQLLRKLLDTA